MARARKTSLCGTDDSGAATPVHVVIIAEHHKFREGIRQLIESTPGCHCLGSFRNITEALTQVPSAEPNVLLIEVRDFKPSELHDYKLTVHEARILQMLAQGHNYKSAAEELQVSINTVSFHMRRIYDKLRVHSKSEAVGKALRQRLVQ